MAARRPDSPPSAAEPVRIERVGADGDGVARDAAGAPLYIPFTLPGEAVRARPVAPRGAGRAAVAEQIDAASAERVSPPCRHFGACGGCALQHWAAAPYQAWKAALLAAALRRAGYDALPAPLQPLPPRTRRRLDFAVRRRGSAIVLGLHAARSGDIVDLAGCEVLHPTLAALLAPLRRLLGGLTALRREGAVIVNLLDSGPDLLLRTDAALTAGDRIRLTGFAAQHGAPRIAWAQGSFSPEIACLLRPATTQLGGVTVAPPPGAFLQASAQGEAAIVAAMLAGLDDRMPQRARIAELHAGCGTLTFPLAGRARVAAFEADAAAAAALLAAVNANRLAGRISVARRDLVRQPLAAAELAGFAAIVLDPPQAGAAAQIAQVAASSIGRVVYVSCSPPALARDAALLRAGGYRLLSAVPIDQFLWSPRLESVSVFAR